MVKEEKIWFCGHFQPDMENMQFNTPLLKAPLWKHSSTRTTRKAGVALKGGTRFLSVWTHIQKRTHIKWNLSSYQHALCANWSTLLAHSGLKFPAES